MIVDVALWVFSYAALRDASFRRKIRRGPRGMWLPYNIIPLALQASLSDDTPAKHDEKAGRNADFDRNRVLLRKRLEGLVHGKVEIGARLVVDPAKVDIS
ncbi:MAG: hypothetical protein U1F15_01745 [Burkholderiales bacterium]